MEVRIDPTKPCDHRPVRVEYFHDGAWTPVDGSFSCTHEAASVVLSAIAVSLEACVLGVVQESDVLALSSFRMVLMDYDEPQPTDLSQACEVLKKFGGKQ